MSLAYRKGILHSADVPLPLIADEIGTPTWCYDIDDIERRARLFLEATADLRPLICYALKANSNQAVIATLARHGIGADVVSGGELSRATAAGVPPERIIYSGVGKTPDEIRMALELGIGQFNVESLPELHSIAAIAAASGHTAPVALRVNPDVDGRTAAKITTGRRDNKFGIPLDEIPHAYALIQGMPNVRAVGLAVHIGSQIFALDAFASAFARVAALTGELRAQGYKVERTDVGGGLGIDYTGCGTDGNIHDYAAVVRNAIMPLGTQIIMEPGRWIVAHAGVLLTRVLYIKETAARRFVIVDAAMNDLLRPALYEAFHPILTVNQPDDHAPLSPADVVGPVCESADSIATNRPMPPVAAGALLAITSVGAYGAAMSSTYNGRPLAPEILVHKGQWAVVRRRQTVAEMLAADSMPPWLDARG